MQVFGLDPPVTGYNPVAGCCDHDNGPLGYTVCCIAVTLIGPGTGGGSNAAGARQPLR
jgi:hypothetical protein